MAKERKPGRPTGSTNIDRAPALSLPPACPSCGSTAREPYRDGPVREERGHFELQGSTYNRIIWRRTRCSDCGQALMVREYHFDPPE